MFKEPTSLKMNDSEVSSECLPSTHLNLAPHERRFLGERFGFPSCFARLNFALGEIIKDLRAAIPWDRFCISAQSPSGRVFVAIV